MEAVGVPVLPGTTTRRTRPSSRRRTACASKFWKEDKNPTDAGPRRACPLLADGSRIPKSQAWYAKLGRQARHPQRRRGQMISRAASSGSPADKAQVPTRSIVLDHFGVDVKDLRAAIARIRRPGHQDRRALSQGC